MQRWNGFVVLMRRIAKPFPLGRQSTTTVVRLSPGFRADPKCLSRWRAAVSAPRFSPLRASQSNAYACAGCGRRIAFTCDDARFRMFLRFWHDVVSKAVAKPGVSVSNMLVS